MLYKHCLFCKDEFKIIPAREKTAKYCSYACRNKGGLRKRINFRCQICNKKMWKNPGRERFTCSKLCASKRHSKLMKGRPSHNKGKKLSFETRQKISKTLKGTRTGKDNHEWKDNDVGYYALHSWVGRSLGKPNKCEHCKITEKGKYHWANISGEYKRNLDDWVRLCVPCHSKMDRSREVSAFS